MTGSKSRSELRARAAGLVAALAAALLFGLWDAPSRALFDVYQRVHPRAQGESATQVVMIDADSIREVGPWPWPRYVLARLTEEIAARGAKVIGFDMLFPEEDRVSPRAIVAIYPELSPAAKGEIGRLTSSDQLFGQVLGSTPTVLARAGVDEDSVDYALAREQATQGLTVEARFTRPLPEGVRTYRRALTNVPDLDDTAEGNGLVNGPTDADGVVRSVPLVARVAQADGDETPDDVATPGIALELARIASGSEAVEPIVSGERLRAVTLGGRTLPVTAVGDMLLHFGHFPVEARTSAVDLLRQNPRGGRFAPDRFRDKVVIVGLTAAGTADAIATPLAAQDWGVFVQAQAVNAILAGEALARPMGTRAVELALGLALALAAIFLVPRLKPWAAAAAPAGIALAVLAASFAAFAAARLLVDPLLPIAMFAAAAGAVLVAAFLRTRAALEAERLSAARAAGELEAARKIQLGMLPPHDQLRSLDPRIDLDAAIEPARSVGGDFYDAVRLPDGRLCFLIADVTGKGVPAALFMTLSKALSKSVLLREGGALGPAVARLSDEIARDNSERLFVTMLIGIADPATGEVELCNAGHEHPLVVRADGSIERLRLKGGPPLSVVEDFAYRTHHLSLAPGDGLVVVTDGVTEAQSPAGDFFGHERIPQVLHGWSGAANEAAERLVAAVRAFEGGGEPSDDVTIVALRYRGA